ncbi:MAG TPA: copper amine oxidase N-terminal domain-containing protein, partial [Chloroflexota bacterium]|nr:copper amine oxidase N-terminal domain-containing protein [Chloroflexota bacterium]
MESLFAQKTLRRRTVALGTLPALLLVAACGPQSTSSTGASPASTSRAGAAPTGAAGTSVSSVTSATKAAELRSGLNTLLVEHLYLAGAATGGALGGRDAEFKGAADALDMNSVDVSKAIGSAYGPDAEKAFLPLWRSHIGFVVDYTQGVAAKDQSKADKAVADLVKYTQDSGAFFNSANGLPRETVAKLLETHVLTLKDVVDAQASGDASKTYVAARKAAGHMHMVGDPLADATAKKFPDKFPGMTMSKASTLRSNLNTTLVEHLYLAGAATGGALGGRDAEFKAAAEALDGNSVDLSKAIGSAYGADAEKAFLPLWRSHIGFVVDYTQGAAAKDKAKQDKAVSDLTKYAQDAAAFFNSANGLPKETLTKLLETHVLTLKDVVDAQVAGDPGKAFMAA